MNFFEKIIHKSFDNKIILKKRQHVILIFQSKIFKSLDQLQFYSYNPQT